MKKKKNVTFSDIANYTNFSKTTISRYFNNPDSLTLENQQIISDALVKLGYQENKVARILANGKTEFIGIIIPDLYYHFYSEILNQILSTYEVFNYKFLIFVGNKSEETERRYIQELLAYKIEGMIILSHTISSKALAGLANRRHMPSPPWNRAAWSPRTRRSSGCTAYSTLAEEIGRASCRERV